VDGTAIRQKIELPHASGECSRRKSLKICDQVAQRGWTSNWNDLPYATRKIRELVPYSPASSDSSDVIQEIKLGSYGDREAFCIEFQTRSSLPWLHVDLRAYSE
jgi:hypothetical protein